VKVEMMTRQMLSMAVERQDAAVTRTSPRIMLASRAGRNAEPTSWVCLTWISRSMSRRAHQQAVDLLVDRVDLFAQLGSEGGAGGGLDMSKTQNFFIIPAQRLAVVAEKRRLRRNLEG